jgi:hypothetical protein
MRSSRSFRQGWRCHRDVTNHGAPVATAGASGKLTVLAGSSKSERAPSSNKEETMSSLISRRRLLLASLTAACRVCFGGSR